jgi:lysophospholipase L1-like esterase
MIEIIDILKPKNGGSFKLIDAIDVAIEGYTSLADCVSHMATTAMIEAINAVLSGKQDKLTTAQLTAVNSGITSELVTQIGTNTTAIAGKADASDLDTTNADLTSAVANLQGQIDLIVTPATSDAEVQNARVDVEGVSFSTLKARLDEEEANNNEVLLSDILLEQGAIGTSGQMVISASRVRTSDYLNGSYKIAIKNGTCKIAKVAYYAASDFSFDSIIDVNATTASVGKANCVSKIVFSKTNASDNITVKELKRSLILETLKDSINTISTELTNTNASLALSQEWINNNTLAVTTEYGGLLADGTVTETNTRCYAKDILCKEGDIFYIDYDSTLVISQFIQMNAAGEYSSSTTGLVGNKFTVPSGCVNFGLTLANDADRTADITTAQKNSIAIRRLRAKGVEELEDETNYLSKIINKYVSFKYGFEYGGVSNSGDIIDNTIRVHSEPIRMPDIPSTLTLEYEGADGLIPKTSYDYNTNTLISTNSKINNYTTQGGGGYIRVSFAKSGDAEFTAQELANIKVKVTTDTLQVIDTELKKKNSNKWFGKLYCAIGDSITYGFIPRNYTGYPGQLDSYAKLTAENLNMTFINYGVSGASVAKVGDRSCISENYTSMDNDADLITVTGGTNDIRNGVELGTMADRTNTTFYGAWHVLLGGLYKKYFIDQGTTSGKKKTVVVITPIKLLQSSASEQGGTGVLKDMTAWVNAIKEVAAYYSFPVLDMYNESGINPHLNQTIQGTEEGYTGYYNPYITDGTHPTQEGAAIMAQKLIGFLNTL